MMDDVRRLEDRLRATAFEYNFAVANQHIGLAHRLSQKIQAIERSLTIRKYGPLATKPESSYQGEMMHYARIQKTIVTYELPLPSTLSHLNEILEIIRRGEPYVAVELTATSETLTWVCTVLINKTNITKEESAPLDS